MRKENKKEKWAKPKLIMLTRGKPEERVLASCKGGLSLPAHAGPVGLYAGRCYAFACVACSSGVPS